MWFFQTLFGKNYSKNMQSGCCTSKKACRDTDEYIQTNACRDINHRRDTKSCTCCLIVHAEHGTKHKHSGGHVWHESKTRQCPHRFNHNRHCTCRTLFNLHQNTFPEHLLLPARPNHHLNLHFCQWQHSLHVHDHHQPKSAAASKP